MPIKMQRPSVCLPLPAGLEAQLSALPPRHRGTVTAFSHPAIVFVDEASRPFSTCPLLFFPLPSAVPLVAVAVATLAAAACLVRHHRSVAAMVMMRFGCDWI